MNYSRDLLTLIINWNFKIYISTVFYTLNNILINYTMKTETGMKETFPEDPPLS